MCVPWSNGEVGDVVFIRRCGCGDGLVVAEIDGSRIGEHRGVVVIVVEVVGGRDIDAGPTIKGGEEGGGYA